MDDKCNNVGQLENSGNVATGAVNMEDQHEWRNGQFKNYVKKWEQEHCILVHDMFRVLGVLDSERDDDDDMEAPKMCSMTMKKAGGSRKRQWSTVEPSNV